MSKASVAVGLGVGAAALTSVFLKVERPDPVSDLEKIMSSSFLCAVGHGKGKYEQFEGTSGFNPKPSFLPNQAVKDCVRQNAPKPAYNIDFFGYSTGDFRIVPR